MNSLTKRISILLILSGLLLTANLTIIGCIGIASVVYGVIALIKNKNIWKIDVTISIINIVAAAITLSFHRLYPIIKSFIPNVYQLYPVLINYNNDNINAYTYISLLLNIVVIVMSAYSIVLADKQVNVSKIEV